MQRTPPSMGLNPGDNDWQVGKTPNSITFVQNVEARLAEGRDDDPMRERLQEAAAAVKSGDRVLLAPLAVDDFLLSGFPD